MTRATACTLLSIAWIAAAGGRALGDPPATADASAIEPAPRKPDASWSEIFAGPFRSSRLFGMPTAQVVGAFQISLSGDASLLTRENTLSTTSVVALGFGDIAQLEYRNAVAISTLEEEPFALPTVGVQVVAPLPRGGGVPDLAVALRFGLAHIERDGELTHAQRATDLYLVSRLALWGRLHRLTLHGGARISQAQITTTASTGTAAPDDVDELLVLPAGGFEISVNDETQVVTELALVPRFDPSSDAARASEIGSATFGRGGIRWRLLPWVVIDASVGYRIEIGRLGTSAESMAEALVDWDIRLGGELFVPWGAMTCKTVGIFCE